MLDFEQHLSLTQPAVLVTIATESVLQDSIIKLLKSLKVMGYTVNAIQGEGRETTTTVDAATAEVNPGVKLTVEIKVIVSSDLSDVILYALKEHQRDFALLVYRQKIEIL